MNSTRSTDHDPSKSKEMCAINTTARGRPLYIYNGFEHRLVKSDALRNLKAYRCIKKKCRGRLHTDFDDGNPRIISEHVHEPNFDAEIKRKRRSLIRELAQAGNVSPSQIIQKARELETQSDLSGEISRASYAAERRYIQRYWNRLKHEETRTNTTDEALLGLSTQDLLASAIQMQLEHHQKQQDTSTRSTSPSSCKKRPKHSTSKSSKVGAKSNPKKGLHKTWIPKEEKLADKQVSELQPSLSFIDLLLDQLQPTVDDMLKNESPSSPQEAEQDVLPQDAEEESCGPNISMLLSDVVMDHSSNGCLERVSNGKPAERSCTVEVSDAYSGQDFVQKHAVAANLELKFSEILLSDIWPNHLSIVTRLHFMQEVLSLMKINGQINLYSTSDSKNRPTVQGLKSLTNRECPLTEKDILVALGITPK